MSVRIHLHSPIDERLQELMRATGTLGLSEIRSSPSADFPHEYNHKPYEMNECDSQRLSTCFASFSEGTYLALMSICL